MFADKYSMETWAGPSMSTVRARHKAAMLGHCSCGPLRDPVAKKALGREWMSCLRCLGTVKTKKFTRHLTM